MSQVALNWAATQPGIATVILGATKLSQMQDNLGALDFAIPAEHRGRLDEVSTIPAPFPYSYFRLTDSGARCRRYCGRRQAFRIRPPALIEGLPASASTS